MGCLLGARRPRTLVAVRCEDIEFKVREYRVVEEGTVLRGVQAHIFFREEKHYDVQGPRSLVDDIQVVRYGACRRIKGSGTAIGR
jgi:hypothetical protein